MDMYTDNNDNYRHYRDYRSEPMTVGEWIIALLITSLPFINFIMLFVWAFSDEVNFNQKNWAKAQLIWMGISTAIVLVIFVLVFGIFRRHFSYIH